MRTFSTRPIPHVGITCYDGYGHVTLIACTCGQDWFNEMKVNRPFPREET